MTSSCEGVTKSTLSSPKDRLSTLFLQIFLVHTRVSLGPATPALRRYYLLFRWLIFCAADRKFRLFLSFLFMNTHSISDKMTPFWERVKYIYIYLYMYIRDFVRTYGTCASQVLPLVPQVDILCSWQKIQIIPVLSVYEN